jgi:hypothetical protein
VDDAGRFGRPERVLAVLLLVAAAWLAAGVVVWVAGLAIGSVELVPWLPLTLLAAVVPVVLVRAALLLLRAAPPRAQEPDPRVGRALGTVAGLAAALFPLGTRAGPVDELQPALLAVPVVLTVACAVAGLVLLVRQHELGIDRLADPPSSLVTSGTALALAWVVVALLWATPGALVAALPGAVIVPLAALGGPPGYRTGLMLGWWWGLVTTGGSLAVAAAVLALGYGQAWGGIVVIGIAVALVAARLALNGVPPGR